MRDKYHKKNPNKLSHDERLERSHKHQEDLYHLKGDVETLAKELLENPDATIDKLERFDQLPISERTRIGLSKGNYKHLTHVQAAALPHALVGRDVLGAAKTGSGKTLAYLVPTLEKLHREQWDGESGLGAMILTPTRELALQIFKVMQVVGGRHPFAAALLTGGRNVDEEKKRLGLMSVIVGTPGRILHHLTESSTLNVDNLQMLVLDEADRLLDMGFYDVVTGILDQLPRGSARQTLLFSATQSGDISALARLCLRDPVHANAHATTVAPTPQNMCQNFMIVELHRKLDVLVSFIKKHPNDKIIVFVSTCNQVKFMYLAISKILKKYRVPTMCLTGKMKQFRRDEVFLTFCRCKSAVLFCTDIAARGLDFPLVHWVVQYDCPESVETYIHRAGRTARAGARGVSLLMLTPQERAMLFFLHQKKVPLREIAMRPNVLHDTAQLFVAMVVQGLKLEAQKAFLSYLRSVQFASNKIVFRPDAIDVEKFSHSLGLLVVPEMNALGDKRSAKNLPWAVANYKASMAAIAKTSATAAGSDNDGDSADDEGGAEVAAAAPSGSTAKTRRERHLAAADMFNQGLDARMRFTTKDRREADTEGDELFTKKKDRPLTDAERERAERQAEAGNADNEDDRDLTYDERIAGLSKQKQRRLVKTGDLRIKDLNLSKRTVFKDADDVDDDEAEDAAPVTVYEAATRLAGDDDDDDEDAMSEHGYAANLRERLLGHSADDKTRVKALKRERRDKKEGRTRDADGNVTKKDKAGGANGDDDSDSDASSDVRFDSVTQRMLRAARGETVTSSDSDDDDEDAVSDDGDDEEEQVQVRQRRPPQPRRR